MSVLELSTTSQNSMSESIIKISTQTIRELTAIAKQQNLCRYYKHKNTDDIALLSEQSIHDMLQYHHQELTSIKKGPYIS